MPLHCLLLPVIAFLCGGDAAKKPQQDSERIQGVWNLISSERQGKKEIGGEKDHLQIEITANTFRFRLPAGARHPQPFELNPGTKPRSIDWLAGGKNGPTKPLRGIYELDGDTLKICWGHQGKERPKEFATKGGAGDWLWVLQRAKPDR